MEKQVKSGLTKAIGLSNFNASQVRRIYEAAEIKPANLQVELHAYLQQKELRDTCKQFNIAVTAYSPLGSPGANTHFSTKYNYRYVILIEKNYHYFSYIFWDLIGHRI